MIRPADLVPHYSSKAFQTRIYALTFVGAVMGATLAWLDQPVRQNILGLALLVVIASLAEMNRRYTYSYLCACKAEARRHSRGSSDGEAWNDFVAMNEGPWSGKAATKRTVRRGFVNRVLLTWATYLPGLAAGSALSVLPGLSFSRPVGIVFPVVLLVWWGQQTLRPVDPESFIPQSPRSGQGNQGP